MERINGFTKPQFISFLETTLIPDLISVGYRETAKDFQTAIRFMRRDNETIHELLLKINRKTK